MLAVMDVMIHLKNGWEVIVIGEERTRVKNWLFTEVP